MMQQIATQPLRVVNAAAPMPRPANVLTPDLKDRLSTMNNACRVLRMMGYRIVLQEMRPDRARPRVKIAPGERSIVPLLDAAGGRPGFLVVNLIRYCCIGFKDVDVLWEVKQ